MSTVGRYVHAGTDVVRRQVEERLHGGGLIPIPSPVPPQVEQVPWQTVELVVAVLRVLAVQDGGEGLPPPGFAKERSIAVTTDQRAFAASQGSLTIDPLTESNRSGPPTGAI
jgi:hypothetical protein